MMKVKRLITPRLKHFAEGSLVTLKIDGRQYTVGQRKDNRYVWLSETSFAGLDCEVAVSNDRYPAFLEMYLERF